MFTIKNLVNSKYGRYITEDLDELSEDTEVRFEPWAIGFDNNDNITDVGVFLGEFNNPEEAINFTKNLTLADILEASEGTPSDQIIKNILVEVEIVIDEDDEAINIGTLYENMFWLNDTDFEEESYTEDEPIIVGEIEYTFD